MLLEIISISTVFDFKSFKKIPFIIKSLYGTVLFFVCMAITHPMPLNKVCVIDDYMNFIRLDSKKYIEQGYEIHGFLIDHKKALTYYKDVKSLPINWHIIKGNNGEYIRSIKKSDYIKSDKKAVLYLNMVGVDFKSALSLNPNAHIIHTNSVSNAKIIYND